MPVSLLAGRRAGVRAARGSLLGLLAALAVLLAWASPTLAATPSMTPADIAFGNVNAGTWSSWETITIANDAGAPDDAVIASLSMSGAHTSSFYVDIDDCRDSGGLRTLAPGESCAVQVAFTPSGSGSRSASFVATVDGSEFTTTLSGTSVSPIAVLTPAGMGFNEIGINGGAIGSSLTLTNSVLANADLHVTSVAVVGAAAAEFTLDDGGCREPGGAYKVLAPGASCTMSITFAPLSLGNKVVNVAVQSDGGYQSTMVSGTGVQALPSLTPPSADFGSQRSGTSSAPQTFTIANDAAASAGLAITGVTIGGTDADQFGGLDLHDCQNSGVFKTLGAGESCTVTVRFSPTSAGAKVATLDVATSSGPLSSALTGTGLAPHATLTPVSFAFADTLAGTNSAPQTFTLANEADGSADLAISDVQLMGVTPTEFLLGSGDCRSGGAFKTLAPGESCAIVVTFVPVSPGPKSSWIEVTTDGGTLQRTLTGTGTASLPSLAPSPRNFGNQRIGTTSSARTLTLTNVTGASAPLTIDSVSVTGAGADQFTGLDLSDCKTGGVFKSIAAGASCTISLTFAPTSTGTKAASVVIETNGGTRTGSVTGTGVRSQLALSPSTVPAFGEQRVTTVSAPRTFTITNEGTASADLTISSISVSDPSQFVLDTSGCRDGVDYEALAPGASCTVTVAFAPSGSGTAATATLDVDTDGGSASVDLEGSGVHTLATLTPSSAAFPATVVGKTAPATTLTVGNDSSATASLHLAGIAVSGADAGQFTDLDLSGCVEDGGLRVLAPGESCTVSISFAPRSAGAKAATVVVDSDGGAPEATLTGEARAAVPQPGQGGNGGGGSGSGDGSGDGDGSGSGGGAGGGTSVPLVTAAPSQFELSLLVSQTGAARVALRCPTGQSACRADGRLVVRLPSWARPRTKPAARRTKAAQAQSAATRMVTVTVARFSKLAIGAGRSRVVTVRLPRGAVGLLQRRNMHRLAGTLTIATQLADGKLARHSTRVAVRIPGHPVKRARTKRATAKQPAAKH